MITLARRKEHTHEQIKTMAIEAVVMHLQHDNIEMLNIQQMATIYSEFALQNRRCFRLVFELSMPDDQPLPIAHLSLIKSLFGLVESQLLQYFPKADSQKIEMMSRVLWGAIHGLTSLALDGKLFEEQSCLQDMLISHVQSYIAGMSIKKEFTCY